MAASTVRYVTYIRCTSEELWRALTASDVVKRYWFGITVDGDWTVGSSWRFYDDGQLMDSGEILESIPQRRLVRSWRNEWKPEFHAEGLSTCVYALEPADGCVKLTVTHSMPRPDSSFIAAVSESWPMCLSNLKSLLETGEVALAAHPGHDA